MGEWIVRKRRFSYIHVNSGFTFKIIYDLMHFLKLNLFYIYMTAGLKIMQLA